MKEENSDLSEELKSLKEMINKGADILGLFNNTDLEDYLMSNEFETRYNNLVNNVLLPLLIKFNNPKIFDDIFQGLFNNPDLIFFQKLEELIKFAYEKDDRITAKLISNFLEIPAIDFFKRPDTRKLMSSIEMVKKIIIFPEKFKNKEFDMNKSIEFFLNILSSVNKETKKMLKVPRLLKIEVENVINLIKNHYETTRYIIGLILGLFDILEGNLNRNLLWYFSRKKSPTLLYYPPKVRNFRQKWLEDYLKLSKYSERFYSFRYILEEWVFKRFKEMRIHKAHKEIDIIQDKLHEGLYNIEIDGVSNKFTLDEIYEVERQTFRFILWTKIIVARQYYQNNEDLVNYLIRNYL